ncbi:MAG TPA: hypothetical protein VM074_02165 [Solimonas sp.]|nr:hypothetical protein [Solimonas sp.]
MRTIYHIALLTCCTALAACQAVPVTPPPASPMAATESGMVIGTLTYSRLDQRASGSRALLRMERVAPHGGPAQTYLIDLRLDERHEQGYFAGTLPAGVYAIGEASSPALRLVPRTLALPFEVQPGRVTDAGHYAMEPRPALIDASDAR